MIDSGCFGNVCRPWFAPQISNGEFHKRWSCGNKRRGTATLWTKSGLRTRGDEQRWTNFDPDHICRDERAQTSPEHFCTETSWRHNHLQSRLWLHHFSERDSEFHLSRLSFPQTHHSDERNPASQIDGDGWRACGTRRGWRSLRQCWCRERWGSRSFSWWSMSNRRCGSSRTVWYFWWNELQEHYVLLNHRQMLWGWAHSATHVPYRDWCPIGVASRGRSSPHRRIVVSETADTLPKFQTDYMFIRTVAESKTQPCITFVETRSGVVISFMCARKGGYEDSKKESCDILKLTVSSIQSSFNAIKRWVSLTCAEKVARGTKRENIVEIRAKNKTSEQRICRSSARAHSRTRTMPPDTNRDEHWHTAFSFFTCHSFCSLLRWTVETPFQNLLVTPYVSPLYMSGESVFALIHRSRSASGQADEQVDQWLLVGRDASSDEHLVVTKHGLLKSRSVRRKPPREQWSRFETVEARGTKWNFEVEMDSWISGPPTASSPDEEMPTATAREKIPTVPPACTCNRRSRAWNARTRSPLRQRPEFVGALEKMPENARCSPLRNSDTSTTSTATPTKSATRQKKTSIIMSIARLGGGNTECTEKPAGNIFIFFFNFAVANELEFTATYIIWEMVVISVSWKEFQKIDRGVCTITPMNTVHTAQYSVSSQAQNAPHALRSRIALSLCARKESVIWSAHVSPFVAFALAVHHEHICFLIHSSIYNDTRTRTTIGTTRSTLRTPSTPSTSPRPPGRQATPSRTTLSWKPAEWRKPFSTSFEPKELATKEIATISRISRTTGTNQWNDAHRAAITEDMD